MDEVGFDEHARQQAKMRLVRLCRVHDGLDVLRQSRLELEESEKKQGGSNGL